MKTKLFTLLFALLSASGAFAAGTKIGNLYYNLDENTRTAEVTFEAAPWNGNGYSYASLSGAVVIPSSITYDNKQYSVIGIDGYAFYGCTGLTSITIPESVTSIGSTAFYGCTGLTSITIPESVTSIGSTAFYGCTGLTSITIPESVTSIGDGAFRGCTGLTSIVWNARNYSDDDIDVFNQIAPQIVSFTLGSNVETIPAKLCRDMSKLTSITVAAGNTVYDSHDNCNAIIETATNKLIAGCKNTVIPNSVTSIGDYAFKGSGLTSITIPNSVTYIGEGAFYGCTDLTSVTLGSSLKVIEKWGFASCVNLQTITCYSQRPPTVQEDGLADVPYSTIIYVPADYLDTYKQHVTWGNYDVRPIDGSAVENVTLQGMRVEAGMLVFGEPAEVSVYTVAGICVHSGMTERLQLPSGVYTVRCGNAACKTLIP